MTAPSTLCNHRLEVDQISQNAQDILVDRTLNLVNVAFPKSEREGGKNCISLAKNSFKFPS